MKSEVLYILVGAVTLLAVGFCEIRADINRILKRAAFTGEYLTYLQKVAILFVFHRQRIDEAAMADFAWLMENVERIQEEVGHNGVMAYRPAYSGSYIPYYALFLNMLPELKIGKADAVQVGFCEDALIRHNGALKRLYEAQCNDLRNPLAWLRRGVQYAVSFPFRLLSWVGLLNQAKFYQIQDSWLVKLISALFTIFGLVSAFFSIVSGWDSTIAFVDQVLHIPHHSAPATAAK